MFPINTLARRQCQPAQRLTSIHEENQAVRCPYLSRSPRGLHSISTNSSSAKQMVVAIQIHALAVSADVLMVGLPRVGLHGGGRAKTIF